MNVVLPPGTAEFGLEASHYSNWSLPKARPARAVGEQIEGSSTHLSIAFEPVTHAPREGEIHSRESRLTTGSFRGPPGTETSISFLLLIIFKLTTLRLTR